MTSKVIKRFVDKESNINVSIWQNDRGYYSWLLEKSYKTKEGEYKNTNFMQLNETKKALELIQQASNWVIEQQKKYPYDNDDDEEEL